MFTVRSSHGRALYSPLLLINPRSFFSSTCRPLAATSKTAPASRFVDKSVLQPVGPVAEQLYATGLWQTHSRYRTPKATTSAATKRRPRKAKGPAGDKARVNIVSEKLCDDILSYIGPSLERHRGCDILDIYPGTSLWSHKLHEFLQPRSHLLLEPDAELYAPFLQPLLDQPGTRIVPKSGIIWRELNSVLTPEFLPHQVIPENPDVPNDTLLVTANLSFHPKKRFMNFDSIASLVLHQFVDSIRSSSLFQRYGLVRMLLWARTDDTLNFLPRTMQRRKKQALENDLLCEWVHEVCGAEADAHNWFVRDDALNIASAVSTAKKMRKAKLSLPPGREPKLFLEALAAVKAKRKLPVPGKALPVFKRPYMEALANLQVADAVDAEAGLAEDPDDQKAKKAYQWRARNENRKAERLFSYMSELDKLIELDKAKVATDASISEDELKWQNEIAEMPKTLQDEFITYKASLHAHRQTPALLEWDRRNYEPMTVEPDEFFPNICCNLLDVQPKALHPLLRQTGPHSTRAADVLDVILGALMHQSTQPIGPGLDSLWPGASDYILPRWTSIQDVSNGGFLPHVAFAGPEPRLLNARQWEQLIELWMEWPFRPEFHELIGRMQDDTGDRIDDGPHNPNEI
ncbi:hypothetical protein ONZ43_g2269 [Nemania bipapillata]|uniref:Uncharacterized protein n=1 Tax=Nemania bipapillata TaxID=110536 RepID=A0ACC2J1N1_9PEZI|nr:hypothetical protein ONZ43_g2269 [Nemania bipapillata]